MYDLIIIGSGPAGISAAISAAKQKLKVLVLTQSVGSFESFIDDARAYPKVSYIAGYDLMRGVVQELKRQGISPQEAEKVTSIEETKEGFIVNADKKKYTSRSILVATGRTFRRLGVNGEGEFEGKGISYCAVCDGENFADQTVAIIGGGRSGLFAAYYMLKYAKKIYLIEKKPDIDRSLRVDQAVKQISKSDKVEILTGTEVIEITGSTIVHGLKIRQKGKSRMLHVEGVFVEIGNEPNTGFISNMVKLNGSKEIIIDKRNSTSRRGIFAAGDVTDVPDKQILVALGEGAKAASASIEYLEKNGLLLNSKK